MPKISIITSVYNCEKFIGETIQSVLNQSFYDWEYIIINDCSSDDSAKVIKSYNDPRIVFVDSKVNRGQVGSLNYGLSISRGEFIARLDHDDICYPDRFQKQVDYLNEHPEAIMCASLYDVWKGGEITSNKKYPIINSEELDFSLPFNTFNIAHSTFMIRKNIIDSSEIRYKNYKYAEDYALLLDLKMNGRIGVINEPLIAYRIFPEQDTQRLGKQIAQQDKLDICEKYYEKEQIPNRHAIFNSIAGELCTNKDYDEFCEAYDSYVTWWKEKNIGKKISDECISFVFCYALSLQIYNMCMWKVVMKSKYCAKMRENKWNLFKLFFKCLIHYPNGNRAV